MIFRNKINKEDDYSVNLEDCLAKTEFVDGKREDIFLKSKWEKVRLRLLNMLHTSFFKQEKHLDYILHYPLIIESTSRAPYYKVKSKGFSNSKIGSIYGLPLIFDKISEG